jgi:hypothetical protein
MSEEEAEKARRVPFNIREWKEKLGEELKYWRWGTGAKENSITASVAMGTCKDAAVYT